MNDSVSGTLDQQVMNWLEDHGYPLEMDVAAAFQQAEFSVGLSEPYEDYETHKQREIDVIAVRWSDLDAPARLQICMSIECKRSRKYPWVVFVSQAQPDWFPPIQVLSSSGARIFLVDLFKQPGVPARLKALSNFGQGYVGHSIVQAFKPEQDVAFQAVSAAVKASIHRALSFENPDTIRFFTKGRSFSCIAIPAIVVDAPLFECFVDKDRRVILKQVEGTTLLWKGNNPAISSSLVRVSTFVGLKDLVAGFSETAQAMVDLARDHQSILDSAATTAYDSILGRRGSHTLG